jgi:thiamine-phosphate pyrophosphorylase
MSDCQLYLITPPRIEDVGAFAKTLETVVSAVPVACLQLRLKEAGNMAESSVVVQAAEAIFPIVRDHGGVCLLNDDPALAAQIGADGVHIGQSDGSVAAAREVLGRDAIVGVTCHTSKDLAFEAVTAGADYVAFGAFFPTPTKVPPSAFEGDDGLELLQWWQETMQVPSVAIGGITPETAPRLVQAGADFLAVSSGVWDGSPGPVESARSLWRVCSEASQ